MKLVEKCDNCNSPVIEMIDAGSPMDSPEYFNVYSINHQTSNTSPTANHSRN
jgi:hypothetical protein